MANLNRECNYIEELKGRKRVVKGNDELRENVKSFLELYTENLSWKPTLDGLNFSRLSSKIAYILNRCSLRRKSMKVFHVGRETKLWFWMDLT